MNRLKRAALLLAAGTLARIIAVLLPVSRAGARARTAINGPDQSGAAKARVAGMLAVDLSGR